MGLDVTLHPAYPAESWVYLTYAGANSDGEWATHLGRGRLSPGGTELEAFEELHVAEPFRDAELYFGSRVVFGNDELHYLTTGDRRDTEFTEDHVSQDTTNDLGAMLRLELDGSISDDNDTLDPGRGGCAGDDGEHRIARSRVGHPRSIRSVRLQSRGASGPVAVESVPTEDRVAVVVGDGFLDRGFYNSGCLELLYAHNYAFVMPIVKWGETIKDELTAAGAA